MTQRPVNAVKSHSTRKTMMKCDSNFCLKEMCSTNMALVLCKYNPLFKVKCLSLGSISVAAHLSASFTQGPEFHPHKLNTFRYLSKDRQIQVGEWLPPRTIPPSIHSFLAQLYPPVGSSKPRQENGSHHEPPNMWLPFGYTKECL